MKRLGGAFALALALGATALGCSGGNNPMDGGTDTPVTPMDGTGEGGTSEGGTDAQGDASGPTCKMISVENLNMLGTTSGTTTRYTGNNNMARDSTAIGLQPPSGQTVCNFRATRQRIFQYTSRTASALRITTTNPGTGATFDTTISVAVGPTCTNTTRVSFCNDDDPEHQGDNRAVSSLLTTDVRPMGTVFFIGLGGFVGPNGERNAPGEQGTFELSIEELAPVAAGGNCDVTGLASVCNAGATCVGSTILSNTGTCQMNGSVAGADCDDAGQCGSGLMCDAANNRCFATVADGMSCQRFTDAWQRCGDTSSCVNLQRGAVTGICRANGSVAGSTCMAGNTCGTGLSCVVPAGSATGICLTTVAAGGMCRTWDTSCPVDMQTCLSSSSGGTSGTCTPNGSALGTDCMGGTTCTTGMCVTPTGGTPTCINSAMSGQPCGPYDQCPTGDTCYLTDPADRYHGICRTPGTLRGNCRTSGTACDTGLTCSDATTPANGQCLRAATVGGACHIFGDELCPTGSRCVPGAANSTTGTCVADGTAAGSTCRAMAPLCDTGLTCSSTAADGLCRTQLTGTAACDPRWGTNACATGSTCRATTLTTGTCQTPSMETEPNDSATAAQMLTGPASVHGALTRFDTDCYAVAVPANGRIFARVTSPAGFCPRSTTVDLFLDLYSSDGRLLGGDNTAGAFGCPRIEGADMTSGNYGWARGLAAGNYTVCVRNNATGGTAVPDYILDLNGSM